MRLIQGNHPEAAKLIIESGNIDVNRKDRNRNTPLMLAANMKGSKDVVEAILAKGADVKAKDGMDMTALHNAVRTGDKDVVEMLVKKGADVNAAARNGQTPYTMALEPPGQPAIAEFLKQNGGKAAHKRHQPLLMGTTLTLAVRQVRAGPRSVLRFKSIRTKFRRR